MSRTLRYVLIAAALLFAQQSAQLHAFAHVPHGSGKSGLPFSGHPASQCLAYHAVDSALANSMRAVKPPRVAPPTVSYFVLPLPFQPRIEFDSRAPPAFS
jgi:hypothetical protein